MRVTESCFCPEDIRRTRSAVRDGGRLSAAVINEMNEEGIKVYFTHIDRLQRDQLGVAQLD